MLNTRKENVIKNTVARMPIHAVIPLLHEVGETAFFCSVIQATFGLHSSWGKSRICLSIFTSEIRLVVLQDRNCS